MDKILDPIKKYHLLLYTQAVGYFGVSLGVAYAVWFDATIAHAWFSVGLAMLFIAFAIWGKRMRKEDETGPEPCPECGTLGADPWMGGICPSCGTDLPEKGES